MDGTKFRINLLLEQERLEDNRYVDQLIEMQEVNEKIFVPDELMIIPWGIYMLF